MKTVIGIDPSLTATAVCRMAEDGSVKMLVYGSKANDGKVYNRLARYMELVDDITIGPLWIPDPKLVLIEGYSYGSNPRSVHLGEFGGLLRQRLVEREHVIEIPPKTLKKFTTGKGNASKIAMVAAIVKRWDVEFKTDDEYDAYALARLGLAVLGVDKVLKIQQELVEGLR